jgi:hypothetical protein
MGHFSFQLPLPSMKGQDMDSTLDLQSIAEAFKAAQDACHSIELLTSQREALQ